MRAPSRLFHAAADPLCRRAHDHLLQVLQCSVWTPLEGLGPGRPGRVTVSDLAPQGAFPARSADFVRRRPCGGDGKLTLRGELAGERADVARLAVRG
ncbi:unnamed protein product [Gulo gulo]|uniref:Uncharacterized protein n=1 Tax=Gulo gulo TaxID=48420 RepID=A0A9X9LLS4_GULGU|nr:unnamed protein product [Gulo gulo]